MTILDRIVDDVRGPLARRKQSTSLADLERRPLFDRAPLDLAEALRGDGLSVIAEIKKASPSKGVIRPDFEPEAFARQYEAHGAAAISVLTDPEHFQGSLDYLEAVRGVSSLPLLRKDFIIDPYQIVEARAYGADAVLLIAAVLERSQLYDLHQAADELGLSCLVELYDIRELDRVDFDQVRILGVNNRDLRTFEVDINHSLEVFRAAPDTVVRVSESGLSRPEDLAHIAEQGIDAALIGEAFMRAEKPGEALGDLLEELKAAQLS